MYDLISHFFIKCLLSMKCRMLITHIITSLHVLQDSLHNFMSVHETVCLIIY